jgi:5-formyltetrahydrofolate cyclo-ligase
VSQLIKSELRKKWRAVTLPPSARRADHDFQIINALRANSDFGAARTVALFAGRYSEVDLGGLVQASGQAFYFPKVNVAQRHLEFYRVRNQNDLTPGYQNILEPDPDRCEKWSGSPLDVILVPGVAFDGDGGRLGSGAGYYDRFLGGLKFRVRKWGVCYSAQISKETLAQDVTDVRMDAVCSELGLRVVTPSGR